MVQSEETDGNLLTVHLVMGEKAAPSPERLSSEDELPRPFLKKAKRKKLKKRRRRRSGSRSSRQEQGSKVLAEKPLPAESGAQGGPKTLPLPPEPAQDLREPLLPQDTAPVEDTADRPTGGRVGLRGGACDR